MSQHFMNPNYKPHMDLGDNGPTDDAQWDEWKGLITAYLDENAGSSSLNLAECRAVSPVFDDPRVWAQASSEVGITVIFKTPEPPEPE